MSTRVRPNAEFDLRAAIYKFSTPAQKRALASLKTDVARAHPKMSPSEVAATVSKILLGGAKYLQEYGDIQKQMRDRFCKLVMAGKLIATGVRISSELATGRTIIPEFLFDDPLLYIEEGRIENFGYRYEAVRIQLFRPAHATKTSEKYRDLESEVAAPMTQRKATPLPDAGRVKRGRTRVDGPLREVIADLRENGKLAGISQKEQVNRVREQARLKHERLFPTPSQPSRTKILEALKADLDSPKSP